MTQAAEEGTSVSLESGPIQVSRSATTVGEAKTVPPVPEGETSGLVDLREITAAMSATHRTAELDDEDDADRTGGFGSLASTSLVDVPVRSITGAAAAVSVASTPASGGSSLHVRYGVVIGVMVVAIGWMGMEVTRLGKLVAQSEQDEKLAAISPALVAERPTPPPRPEPPAPRPTIEEPSEPEDPPPAADEPAPRDDGSEHANKPAQTAPRRARDGARPEPTHARTSSSASEPGSSAPPPPSPAPAPEPPKTPTQVMTADCLLDPNAPGCEHAKKPEAKVEPTAAVDPNLPEQLSQAQVRDGFAAVKEQAKSCGPQHGAALGTKVRVKVSIAGDSGQVLSASAQDAPTPALGTCIADALKKASFPKFRKQQMGLVYPVQL